MKPKNTKTKDRQKPHKDASGQLFVAGALILAVSVFGVAVMLNSAMYSKTASFQNTGAGMDGPKQVDATDRALRKGMSGTGKTPSDASVEYGRYTDSYESIIGDSIGREGRSLKISAPDSKTPAWSAGQGNTTEFENATGGEDWIMAEMIGDTYRMEFNVSMPSVSTNSYRLNASVGSPTVPPPVSWESVISNGWYMTLSESGGDLSVDVVGYGSESGGSASATVSPEDGYAEFDLLGVIEGSSLSLPEAVRFEEGSDLKGKYDFRFEDSPTDVSGPCSAPCKGTGEKKYAVGVLHEVEGVTVEYRGTYGSYTEETNITLGTNEATTEGVPKVSGGSYLRTGITGNNSPVNLGSDIDIDYTVENIGTKQSSEDVELVVGTETTTPEDTDTVTVTPGNTESGTLTWDTSGTEPGVYTAFVRTDDSVDSVRVIVNGNTGDAGVKGGVVGTYITGTQLRRAAQEAERG